MTLLYLCWECKKEERLTFPPSPEIITPLPWPPSAVRCDCGGIMNPHHRLQVRRNDTSELVEIHEGDRSAHWVEIENSELDGLIDDLETFRDAGLTPERLHERLKAIYRALGVGEEARDGYAETTARLVLKFVECEARFQEQLRRENKG